MRGWTPALDASELAPGEGAILEIRGEAVALFREGDTFRALSAVCPHQGTLLCEFLTDERTALCPSHGWEFRIDDGQCLSHRTQRVRTFAVRVEDGLVYVKVRFMTSWILDCFSLRRGQAQRLR
jgi:nitrite reductase (NADH) small subunit